MNERTLPSAAARCAEVALPEPFDGYPYLVTRIGHSALRHMAVLPADWPRGRLLDLARRQAQANRLETCLAIGPSEAVFFTPDGESLDSVIIPTGIPVVDRLALVEPVPQTDEVAVRRLDLQCFRFRQSKTQDFVNDPVPADAIDPVGLERHEIVWRLAN